jgi:hypothetical protein
MSKELIDTDLLYSNDTSLADDDDGIPMHNVSTVGLGQITKNKQQVDQKIAKKMHELEQLEYMYHELEEKSTFLDKLSAHQNLVEQNRRQMVLRLTKSLILLNKQENETLKFFQLIEKSRLAFEKTLEDLKSVDCNKWANDDRDFSEDLAATAALVEAAEKEFLRISSKIKTASFYMSPNKMQSNFAFIEHFNDELNGKSFSYILKAGFVFALPMICFLILFFLLIKIFK